MNGGVFGRNSSDSVAEPKEATGDENCSPSAEVAHESQGENLALETLNRYIAAATEDREAAEDRSSQVITRFTKLTIAMLCLTTVIAVANVAMIVRQSSAAQPAMVALPHPAQPPAVLVPPTPPALPAPSESRESTRPPEHIPLLGSPPAEKIPLLGSPSSKKAKPAPELPRVYRATNMQPHLRPQPLLSARDDGEDSRGSGPAERW